MTAHKTPETLKRPEGHNVFVIPDDEIEELLQPPQIIMPVSGYMDLEGRIHYELCHTSWYLPQGFIPQLKILLDFRNYYMSIPDKICANCLTKDPNELIGAGLSMYYPEKQLHHLLFLGLRARAEIPSVDSVQRKEAIFSFQRSYNRMVQWMGATRATTYTGIIPDKKMQALGWRPYELAGWAERWQIIRECTPASFLAKVRTYEIKYP